MIGIIWTTANILRTTTAIIVWATKSVPWTTSECTGNAYRTSLWVYLDMLPIYYTYYVYHWISLGEHVVWSHLCTYREWSSHDNVMIVRDHNLPFYFYSHQDWVGSRRDQRTV